MHTVGVPIMLGTDSPTVPGVPGFSAHEELLALGTTGLPPIEIPKIATRHASESINQTLPGRTRLGVITVAATADLILLEDNPLNNLAHSQSIVGVTYRGHWRSADWFRPRLEAIATSYTAP